MGHTLSDNRHGLIASAVATQADGFAERDSAKVMVADAKQVAHEEAQITNEPKFQIAKSVPGNSAHAGRDARFDGQYFRSLLSPINNGNIVRL